MSAIVPIIMGSKSDLEHGTAVATALDGYGLESELRVASAHKAAAYLLDVLREYETDPRPKVYVTIAGRSNALSGLVDGNVAAPVIACPPYSDRFGGADIFSSLRMPSGIAPAVVLDPAAAALLVAKILGVTDAEIRRKVLAAQTTASDAVAAADRELNPDYPAV
jgi:5-(carboxyamino)imidazole ribonucleotide mutase